jgi:predicted XRE-type DNA-binding protein
MEQTEEPNERPILGISGAEAATILGIRETSVSRLVRRGLLRPAPFAHKALDRDEVERLALERYKPGPPYWLNTADVANLLGVSKQRVGQLVRKEFLPAVEHNGRRLFRRDQVEVIGNARDARWHQGILFRGQG